jgi:hypothetical protein
VPDTKCNEKPYSGYGVVLVTDAQTDGQIDVVKPTGAFFIFVAKAPKN